MEYVISGLGIGLVVLVAIVFIRAMLFVPKKQVVISKTPIDLNKEKAVSDLARMIQCKTISNRNHDLEDTNQFKKFKMLIDT